MPNRCKGALFGDVTSRLPHHVMQPILWEGHMLSICKLWDSHVSKGNWKKYIRYQKKHVCWQCPQDLLFSTATVLFRWKQILRMCHVFNVWSQIERAQFKGAKNGVTTGGSLLDFLRWRSEGRMHHPWKIVVNLKNNNCCKMLQVNKRIKRLMLWAFKTQ